MYDCACVCCSNLPSWLAQSPSAFAHIDNEHPTLHPWADEIILFLASCDVVSRAMAMEIRAVLPQVVKNTNFVESTSMWRSVQLASVSGLCDYLGFL